MADKKFYWLKLKKDFFKRHDIKIVEDMDNGKEYVLFYIKLLCESVAHKGNLRFSDTIPYNEKMLATITNTNIDVVRSALKLFQELELVEILDDQTIFLHEVQCLMGQESSSAERVRRHRASKSLPLQCNTDVTNCNIEEEEEDKSLDIDLDIKTEEEVSQSSSSSPKASLVKIYGTQIIEAYEKKYIAWCQKKGRRIDYDSMYNTIGNWIKEDNPSPQPTTAADTRSSIDVDGLMEDVMAKYRGYNS